MNTTKVMSVGRIFRRTLFPLGCLFALGSVVLAQVPDPAQQNYIKGIMGDPLYTSSINNFSDDADYLYNGYAESSVKSIASLLNAGWFNSAKSLGNFPKFSISVVGMVSNTPAKDKTFFVDNNQLKLLQLKGDQGVLESRTVATALGDPGLGTPRFEAKKVSLPGGNDVHPEQLPMLRAGTGMNFMPLVYLQGQIGLFKGTDVAFKFFPAINLGGGGDLKVRTGWLYGVGLMHELSQWFYESKEDEKARKKPYIPDLSLQGGFTVYDVRTTPTVDFIKEGMVDGKVLIASETPTSFQEFKANLKPLESQFDFTAWNVNLAASWQVSILRPFVAVGYNVVNATQRVVGDFPVVILDVLDDVEKMGPSFGTGQKYLLSKVSNPISERTTQYSNLMISGGVKMKLGVFILNASYQYTGHSVYNLGVGIEI